MNKICAKDILKKENIVKGSINSTLKEALTHLSRSHDALFVFDDRGKFYGVINPYYVLFKSSYPPNTKLEKCAYRPPILTPHTTLWDIARLMLESKLYFLPVIENGSFLGIVTVNRLLKKIAESSNREPIVIIPNTKLITIHKDASLQDAYQLMKDKQISRLPVVSPTQKLVGIVTRYDIQEVFTKPKQKPRFLSRSGVKQSQLYKPLKDYYKKLVVTLPISTTGKKIVETILSKKVGSVVLIDKYFKPVGIVSIHDILKAISTIRPKKHPHSIYKLPKEFIHTVKLEQITSRFLNKSMRRFHIHHLEIQLTLQKNRVGKIQSYTFEAIVSTNRKKLRAVATHHDWIQAFRSSLKKLERQFTRK